MSDADFLKYKALMFAFPGAVLAGTIDFYLRGSIVDVLIFVLAFVFVPVEAYSSHLWEQVNAHGRATSHLDYVQEIALAVIDLVRVAFLTLAIAQYPKIADAQAGSPAPTNLALFLGVFLLLNYAWNIVAKPLETGISTIFGVRLQQILASGRVVERAVARATEVLLAINRVTFFFFFPVTAGVILIAYVLSLLAPDQTAGSALLASMLRAHYVSLFSVFLVVQIVLKLTQIAVIRVVLSMDLAYQVAEPSAAGLISQVASAAQYSVFIVSSASTALQQTNFDLTHLMAARMQLYLGDKHRRYIDLEHLVFDPSWDQVSAHVVYVEGERILGMIRITPSVDSRLPICEAFPELKFDETSYELSRMIIDDGHRRDPSTAIAARLFVGTAAFLATRAPTCIVIDAITGTNFVIKERTYARMGFAFQRLRYRDRRYAADSIVLKASDQKDVARFFAWADRMSARFGRA